MKPEYYIFKDEIFLNLDEVEEKDKAIALYRIEEPDSEKYTIVANLSGGGHCCCEKCSDEQRDYIVSILFKGAITFSAS